MVGEKAYRLNDNGLLELNNNKEDNGKVLEGADQGNKIYKIEKIAAKIGERILLFDPKEIDYVESEQGVSNLSIRGVKRYTKIIIYWNFVIIEIWKSWDRGIKNEKYYFNEKC